MNSAARLRCLWYSRRLPRTSALRKIEVKLCSAIFTYWALFHSGGLVSVLGIWVRNFIISLVIAPRFRYIITQHKLRKCRISNAKSRVDVGDRLRDCRKENIHTRNTLVIAFSYVALGLRYTVFSHFIYSNTATCLATNLWRYLCASKRLIWQLWTCVLSISEVNFIVAI